MVKRQALIGSRGELEADWLFTLIALPSSRANLQGVSDWLLETPHEIRSGQRQCLFSKATGIRYSVSERIKKKRKEKRDSERERKETTNYFGSFIQEYFMDLVETAFYIVLLIRFNEVGRSVVFMLQLILLLLSLSIRNYFIALSILRPLKKMKKKF